MGREGTAKTVHLVPQSWTRRSNGLAIAAAPLVRPWPVCRLHVPAHGPNHPARQELGWNFRNPAVLPPHSHTLAVLGNLRCHT